MERQRTVDDARQGVNLAGVEKFNKENGTDISVAEATNQASQAFEKYLSLTHPPSSLPPPVLSSFLFQVPLSITLRSLR